MLAWGNHFMWFTKLWFEYAPFYNKFRTVSMALIVLQVTLPLLGFYALDKIIKGQYQKAEILKSIYIAFGITGGFCLISALLPGLAGTFYAASDAQYGEMLAETLAADRAALLKSDAWRSFGLIAVTAVLIWWGLKKERMAAVAFTVIILVGIDLFPAGKRYLNKEHFITPKDFSAQYELRPVDEIILEDPSLDYRVLDISVNTFNSSIPSYHHKTIGGYSPVKLQRYQDLIEKYITGEIYKVYDSVENAETVSEVTEGLPELKVVSMLNGKYIILGADYPPVVNKHAYGNAWFVSSFVPAATPDEEIALLEHADLRNSAVIGADFKTSIDYITEIPDSVMSTIALTHYAPNELRYTFSTSAERAAIFSEIYYPKGWKAWIEPAGSYGQVRKGHYQPTADAKSIDLFRANWMLRGAVLPEGEGQLIMRFEPDSYQLGENISLASSIALILLLIASIIVVALPKRK
jgi:hypothetical protein